MYQGQLCKIQVHENRDPTFTKVVGADGGWFLKLKDENGKTKFHLVSRNRTEEMSIDPAMVDESLHNESPTKPFYVVCVVPASLQPVALSVSPNVDSLVTKACLNSKIGMLESSRNLLFRSLEIVEEKVTRHKDRIAELGKQMDELLKIASMPDPYFLYAYGKHSADGQEFSWRIPSGLYGQVHTGATVIADTKFGPQPVVVTRIERSSYLLDHKLIISLG